MKNKILIVVSLLLISLLWIAASGHQKKSDPAQVVSITRAALKDAGFEKIKVTDDGSGVLVLRGSVNSENDAVEIEKIALQQERVRQVDRSNLTWEDIRPAPYLGLILFADTLVVTGEVNNHTVKAKILKDFQETFGPSQKIEDRIEVSRAIDNPPTFYAPAEGARSLDFFQPEGAVAAIRNDGNWSGGGSELSDEALVASLANAVNNDHAATDLVSLLRSRENTQRLGQELANTNTSLAAVKVAKEESDRIRSEAEVSAAKAITDAQEAVRTRDKALAEARLAQQKKAEAIQAATEAKSTAEKALAAEAEAKARENAAQKQRAAAYTARETAKKALAATEAKNRQLSDVARKLQATRNNLGKALAAKALAEKEAARIPAMLEAQATAEAAATAARKKAVTAMEKAIQLEADLNTANSELEAIPKLEKDNSELTKKLTTSSDELNKATAEAERSAKMARTSSLAQAEKTKQLAMLETKLAAAEQAKVESIKEGAALLRQIKELEVANTRNSEETRIAKENMAKALRAATATSVEASRRMEEALKERAVAVGERDIAQRAATEARRVAAKAKTVADAALAARNKLESDLQVALAKQLQSARSTEQAAALLEKQKAAAAEAGAARQLAQAALAEAQAKLTAQAKLGAELKALQNKEQALAEEVRKATDLITAERKARNEAVDATRKAEQALATALTAREKSDKEIAEQITQRDGQITALNAQIEGFKQQLAKRPDPNIQKKTSAALTQLKKDQELTLAQLHRAEAGRDKAVAENKKLSLALENNIIDAAALDQVVQQLQASKDAFTQLESKNQNSEQALQKALADLGTAKKGNNDLNTRNKELAENLKRLGEALKNKDGELADLKHQQQTLTEQLAKAVNDAATLKQRSEKKEKVTAESAARLAELQKQLDASKTKGNQSDARNKELENLIAQLKEKQKASAEAASKLQATLEANAALGKELANLKNQLTGSAGKISGLEQALDTSKGQLSKLEQATAAAAAKQAELEKQLDASTARGNQSDARNKELENLIAQLKEKQKVSAEAASRLQATLEANAALGKELANLKNQLTGSAGKISGLEQALNTSKGQLSKLEQNAQKASGRITNLEQAAEKSAADAFREAEMRLRADEKKKNIENALAGTRAELAKAQKTAEEVQRLTQETKKLMADIDSKNTQVVEAMSLKEKAENEAKTTLARLNETQGSLDMLKGTNAELTASKDSLEKSLAKQMVDLRNLRAQMEALKNDKNQIQGRAEELKKRFVQIDPIRYSLNSANVTAQQERVLAQITEILDAFPNARFEIIGHTCDVGEREGNLNLSKQRAENLVKFLIKKGVTEDKLKSRGVADDQPLAPNDSTENRRKNRRVEITFQDS